MDVSLEQRLIRFLDREEDDELRSNEDLRALSIDDRVLEGECIKDAVLLRAQGNDVLEFEVDENVSKFRAGDRLTVSDGLDLGTGLSMIYGGYEPQNRRLRLQRDRFARASDLRLRANHIYCIDRRTVGARGRLHDVVRAGFADTDVSAALRGELSLTKDTGRYDRATALLTGQGLNPSQVVAGAEAIACDQLTLVQGPPGTGKTRLLAEVVAALCARGCRIALSAFTHRAVDNALLALRRIDPDLQLIKLGYPRGTDRELLRAGIRLVNPRHGHRLPTTSAVIAGTCFALAKLPSQRTFHYTFFDEAAQLPIPHAIAGMLLSQRWILLGDHCQLPPVVKAHHTDGEVTRSIFAHFADHYPPHLLDVTYRMNRDICDVVSRAFYGDALTSADSAADRRLPVRPGGTFDDVLRPDRGAVLARIDHLQPGKRSPEEANLIADLIDELVRHHGFGPGEIAVVAPFRAQVRLIRTAIEKKALPDVAALTVDTVERIQGQERDVVLISMAVGDADSLDHRAAFFFSVNRLNVALSRARRKVVLVASRGAFAALPTDPASLRAVNAFRRLVAALPQVDLTRVYALSGLENASE